jgi:hypothetical protein
MSVTLTAVFLALFALQLWNIVRTRKIRTWEIAGIIGGDIAWVAGSFVLIAIHYDSVSSLGIVLIDLVAFAVLLFLHFADSGLARISNKRYRPVNERWSGLSSFWSKRRRVMVLKF